MEAFVIWKLLPTVIWKLLPTVIARLTRGKCTKGKSIFQQWLMLFIGTVNSNYTARNAPSLVAWVDFFVGVLLLLQFHYDLL